MNSFLPHTSKATQGVLLTEEEMSEAIGLMMDGTVGDSDAEAFLTALADRGEVASELTGGARAMRHRAATIVAPQGTIDCCGTGGDGANTYNISTAVALVAAACGAKIAKHGNRSSTSKSGAADVLEALGVNLSLSPMRLEQALHDFGFCFLMAPNHHKAMLHVASVRRKIGRRTIFNLLGPLSNPAGAQKQLVGVFAPEWLMPMAKALHSLGTQEALVVHGTDGLDEITLGGETRVAHLKDGQITERTFTPDDFGLPHIGKDQMTGGDAQVNAKALADLLDARKSAYRDVVLANTAGVLSLHDGRDLKDGVAAAAEAIDSGRVRDLLNRYRELTP